MTHEGKLDCKMSPNDGSEQLSNRKCSPSPIDIKNVTLRN